MKLCGIIVTYYPEHQRLEKNVKSVIHDVDKLIIWDNTPDESFLNKSIFKTFENKILIMGLGENLGIAAALNKGVEWAINNNFSHILTLDQDSFFVKGGVNKFKSEIKKIHNEKAIFAPNLLCHDKYVFPKNNSLTIVADTITSGSLFPINVFLKCGLFNERLFIDAVDYEFCYRAYTLEGYKTIIINEIVLNHEVGYKALNRLGFYSDNYSAFRIFYIIRNHIMTWRAYPKLFQRRHKMVLIINHILLRIPKVLLGEKDKKDKIFSIFKGLYKGLFTKNLIKINEQK